MNDNMIESETTAAGGLDVRIAEELVERARAEGLERLDCSGPADHVAVRIANRGAAPLPDSRSGQCACASVPSRTAPEPYRQ
ncbi:hypothetical protein [Glycomyces arizonensis]|uniref:hypothetical protein n=1 Tax=Glycomyces arizonensis TaxID=256035 RepID=UPI0003FA4D81|nr:hypothetical protein [Glycomyces arizonensis]